MAYKFGSEACAKERFYQLPAPADPVAQAAAARRPHVNAATGRALFRQSMMPVGEHLGKIMERVPADYLRWVATQEWMRGHRLWGPVWEYVEREGAALRCSPWRRTSTACRWR